MKTCGECRFFRISKASTRFGDCKAPVPESVNNQWKNMVDNDSWQAEYCPCYQPKEEPK